jgi:hypothetical protein
MRLRLFCLLMCTILVALGEERMSGEQGPSVQNSERSSEMNLFDNALREIMTVSKEDLKRLQDAEKAAKADKPRRGPKPKSR